jgi:orotate phosphoribosyltransferase
MLDGELFTRVGEMIAHKMTSRDINQVAGYGYGAFPLVGAVLSASGPIRFRGGFVREHRKAHGRRRLIEGPLDKNRPIAILDDILNSGRSALRTLTLLRSEGFEVSGLFTLFNFTWGDGRERIESEGLWVDTLLDLNLQEESISLQDPSLTMV